MFSLYNEYEVIINGKKKTIRFIGKDLELLFKEYKIPYKILKKEGK